MVLFIIRLFLRDIRGGLAHKAPVATSRLAGLSGKLAEGENFYETKEVTFGTKPLC